MTHRYYDLITASVEVDTSVLQEKLDELEAFDASDFETRIATLEGLNTCGVDVNDLSDAPSRLDQLEGNVSELDQRITDALGEANLHDLSGRIEKLEALMQTAAALTGDRLDRIEASTNLSYNFFALAGKMVSLLLNGPRS